VWNGKKDSRRKAFPLMAAGSIDADVDFGDKQQYDLDEVTGMAYSPVRSPGDLTMAITRAKLVDLTLTRWYRCVSRCVRRAFLLAEGDHNRKEWLENRLEELADIFAVAIVGFSVIIDLNPVAAKIAKTPETSDYTFREEKASISAELAGIFERLGCSTQSWQIQIKKLCGDRLVGRFFAASSAKLQEICERLGVRHPVNLRGCPIR
jgi:hypothetical protein